MLLNALTRSSPDRYSLQLTEPQIETEIFNRTWDAVISELRAEANNPRFADVVAIYKTQPDASTARLTKCFDQTSPGSHESVKNKLLSAAAVIKDLYKDRWLFNWDNDRNDRIDKLFKETSIPYTFPLLEQAVFSHDDLYYLGLRASDITAARDEAFDPLAWAAMKMRLPSLAAKIKEVYLASSCGAIDLLSCGLTRTAEAPQPGDLVLYSQEEKAVLCGVYDGADEVLFKEKEGVAKRKIWSIYPRLKADVVFLRGGARAEFAADTEKKLESGLTIPPELIALIDRVADGLPLTKKNGFTTIKEQKVVTHKKFPQFIIKLAREEKKHDYEKMEQRFKNIVQAERICQVFQLHLLVIPRVKKFCLIKQEVRHLFLVEECLDFEPSDKTQDELYKKYSPQFDETARQIALFVAETGFHDVHPRNLPILNEKEEYQGDRRVGLIDLEHVNPDNKSGGFWGYFNSYGVIRCLYSEKQIDVAMEIAKRYHVRSGLIDTKTVRMAEIKHGERVLK